MGFIWAQSDLDASMGFIWAQSDGDVLWCDHKALLGALREALGIWRSRLPT